MSFIISLYLTSLLSALFSVLFIGVKFLEDPSNKGLRSFFVCFLLIFTALVFFMTKGILPKFFSFFTGGLAYFCGMIFYSAGLNHLVGKSRSKVWYIIPLLAFTVITYYYCEIDFHLGIRLIVSSALIVSLISYMLYDVFMHYKTETKSVKVLILFVLAQIGLIFFVEIFLAIIDFSLIKYSVEQSESLMFIHKLFPICIIESGFMCLLLIADAATIKERETADRLMRVLNERDQLYATVAHELNSPLNATRHMIELLKLSKQKKNQPDVFDAVSTTLGDLRRILTDLLNWANRRQDGDALSIGVVSDIEIRKIIAPFLDSMNEKRMKMELFLPEKTKRQIDTDLLFIVMRVLMSNAVRHGKPYSSITISLCDASDQCIVTVTNETDTDNQNTGQGLGLKLLKDQIEQAEGSLSLEHGSQKFTATAILPFF